MKLAPTIAPYQFAANRVQSSAVLQSLDAGEIPKIDFPIGTSSPGWAAIIDDARKHLAQMNASNQANININIHFENHHETNLAFQSIKAAMPAVAPTAVIGDTAGQVRRLPVQLTLKQGVAGGAMIGTIGGAGLAAILLSVKSTADAIGHPIIGTLGSILAGIAVGATTGAIIATDYDLHIGKDGGWLKRNQPAST